MAKYVIVAPVITIATVNYDAQISSFTLDLTTDTPETTNFDSAGWKEMIAGLRSYAIGLTFVKDADQSGLDAAIWGEVITPTAGGIAWTATRVTGGPTTAIPVFGGNVIVSNWSTIAGNVGDVFGGTVSWPGVGAPSRATV